MIDDPEGSRPAGSSNLNPEVGQRLPQVLPYSSGGIGSKSLISRIDFDAISVGLPLLAVFGMGVIVPIIAVRLPPLAGQDFLKKSVQVSQLMAGIAFCTAIVGLCVTKCKRPFFLLFSLLLCAFAYCSTFLFAITCFW